MTKETMNSDELNRAKKKAQRRASLESRGRLTLEDKYKEDGYRYRVVNVLPGNIENAKSRGYEVVTHSLQSGSGLTSQPEVNGTPVEIEVGGANGSMKAVWMRISEDDAEILDEITADLAQEQENIIYDDPIPEKNRASNSPLTQGTNIGKITKENLR